MYSVDILGFISQTEWSGTSEISSEKSKISNFALISGFFDLVFWNLD